MRRWRLALALGEWLDSAGDDGLPNLVHYNAMLSACAAAGQHGPAQDLLSQMETRGIAPDQQSYATAVSACERAGACATPYPARHASKAAPAAAVRPPQPHPADRRRRRGGTGSGGGGGGPRGGPRGAGVARDGVHRRDVGGGRWRDVALGILDRMRERGSPPTLTPAPPRSAPAARAGAGARAISREMREIDGVEPNGYSYSLAIGACSRAGRRSGFEAGRLWTTSTFRRRPRATASNSRPAPSPSRQMETSRDAHGEHVCVECGFRCSRAGEWAEAIALYGKMGEYSSRPSVAGPAAPPPPLLRRRRREPAPVADGGRRGASARTTRWRRATKEWLPHHDGDERVPRRPRRRRLGRRRAYEAMGAAAPPTSSRKCAPRGGGERIRSARSSCSKTEGAGVSEGAPGPRGGVTNS